MPKLPNTVVPESAMELMTAYAASKNITVGQAIRALLKNSPELNEFAKANNLQVEFDVRDWGGRRIPKDVQDELDALRNKNP